MRTTDCTHRWTKKHLNEFKPHIYGSWKKCVLCGTVEWIMPNDDLIHVWPCGTYCYPEDLEDYLTMQSDDYETMTKEQAVYMGLVDESVFL